MDSSLLVTHLSYRTSPSYINPTLTTYPFHTTPTQYPSHPPHRPLPISMAIPPPSFLPLLLLALAALLSFLLPAAIVVDLRLLHVFDRLSHLHHPDPFSPSSFEATLLSLTSHDEARIIALAATTTSLARCQKAAPGAPIAAGCYLLQTSTYVVRTGIGTPPQPLLLAVDTSNDAAWIPCTGCPSSSISFSPANSSTFQPLPCGSTLCSQVPNPSCPSTTSADALGTSCSFNLTYGSSSLQATLVQDLLSLATDVISGYSFGCLQTVTGASFPPQSLFGLGPAPLLLHRSLFCHPRPLLHQQRGRIGLVRTLRRFPRPLQYAILEPRMGDPDRRPKLL